MRHAHLSLAVATLLLAAQALAADTVRLQNGDELSGTILDQTDATLVLQHAVLGRLEIPRDQVKEEEPDRGAFGTGLLVGWEREIELGVSGSEGVSQNFTARGGLRLGVEDEARRWDFRGRYYKNRSDGVTGDHNARLSLTHFHHFHGERERWAWVSDAAWDWDRFQDWEHRLQGHTGPGYFFIENETFELVGVAGLGGQQEFGTGRSFRPEGVVGARMRWKPFDGQKVELFTLFYPVLRPLGEYRARSGGDWTLKLNEARNLSLRLGFTHEYRSEVDEGTSPNDLKYHTSLVVGF
jgi:hypothetical protein